jgi:hypothetical protein
MTFFTGMMFNDSFNKAESKHCVTRRELLAVVASIKNFNHYLYGRNSKLEVIMEH